MIQTDIILENISKSFGSTAVFSNLNLTFKAGTAYCLMAPSGAGKTTLLKLLMGLIPPDSGRIHGLNGKKISAVFQEDRLLEDCTALQNLRFVTGSCNTGSQLAQKLTALLPKDCLNRPVSEFSGGMKRRLSILRALLVPFDLLLLDEPFTGLDPENKRAAIQLIRENTGGRLLILATHCAEDAAILNARTINLPTLPLADSDIFIHKIP